MALNSPSPGGARRPRASIPSGRRRGFTSWRPRSDADIAASLRSSLAERPDAAAIDFVVVDGVVNLTGELEDRRDTESVRRTAIGVIGVRRVNDWLTSTDETPYVDL